ncbi:milk fat globule EGF and factor V/VIII domain containing b [Trichomycterus rosablanca]|uniref:milk fat globule EGF and factor V/VIII domain containing b n=1 Tax=Trichomycterus rosablanca TaxID=2290929 RepID=UPI002F352C7F
MRSYSAFPLSAACFLWVCFSAVRGDFCEVNVCKNAGTCVKKVGRDPFICICPDGFTGDTCDEKETGPCHPNPCKNDGICQARRGDVFSGYDCKCPKGFDGVHCQNNVNDCAIHPCQNGGSCIDLDGDFHCKCRSPYVGIHCQLRCISMLGMEGGGISESQISASSVHYGILGLQRWGPELARLNNKGLVNAWTAASHDRKPYIEINMHRIMRFTGIITQGASRVGTAEYIKTFKVAHSSDGRLYTMYRGDGQKKDIVFLGNRNNDEPKSNLFDPPIVAQYIRILPMLFRNGCTLRMELVGCELNGCSESLGFKSRLIGDAQLTASSTFRTWGIEALTWHPHYARLDKQGKTNAWTAATNSRSEWLQVDLLSPKRITGIITQGAKDFGNVQFISAYKVAYSDNGRHWTVVEDDKTNSEQIFPGNSDNNVHKRNLFDPPLFARFVRVLPWEWHEAITLRMELLGCDE